MKVPLVAFLFKEEMVPDTSSKSYVFCTYIHRITKQQVLFPILLRVSVTTNVRFFHFCPRAEFFRLTLKNEEGGRKEEKETERRKEERKYCGLIVGLN